MDEETIRRAVDVALKTLCGKSGSPGWGGEVLSRNTQLVSVKHSPG